jgi:uncharacterized phage protein (TIGR02218 family)
MSAAALQAHLASCATTVCRAWAVTRRDGVVLGFTDHDAPLAFEGISFVASSGMSARAVEQTTGLSVDNSEAVGVLSDPAIREADIKAGRFDGAAVRAWSVNWANVEERRLVFRGSLGEIERAGGAFRAELRGLAEALNQPSGRVYQRHCGAVLGSAGCGVDLTDPGFWIEADVISIERGTGFRLASESGHSDGWFTRGAIEILTGAGAGDVGLIKRDRQVAEVRLIETWDVLSAGLAPGDRVRLVAGCDKRGETCKVKFSNYSRFQGFPDIPGEDWLVSYPTRAGGNSGGSLRS